jgi:glutamate-1-semialdehyde 2,1-aminomutase
MERINGWKRLEELGASMETSIREIIRGKPLAFDRIGSMFCLYFTEGPVRNLSDAKRSDTTAFARFFHGALSKGIYLAPSQFEAGFICTAHTPEVLEAVAGKMAPLLN